MEGRSAEAMADVNQAISLDPQDGASRLTQARIFQAMQLRAEAMEAVANALLLDPEDDDAIALQGALYLDDGNIEHAETNARRVLEHDPEHVDALVLVGHVRLKTGHADEALEHALWALQISPHDIDAIALLAAVKMRQSPLTGLWWRYNAWMSRYGQKGAIAILIAAFILYRFASIALTDAGHAPLATGLTLLWLLLCIYTWSGQSIMQNMIDRELKQVRLRPDF